MTRRAEQRVGATRFRRWLLRAAGVTLASAGAVCMSAAVASADDSDGPLAPLTSTVEKASTTAVEPVADTVAQVSRRAAEPVAKPVEKVTEKVVEPVATSVTPVADPVVDAVEPVTAPVAEAAEPVLKPAADSLKPANELVEGVVTPFVPVIEPIVDVVAPVVEGIAEETGEVLPPIGLLLPGSVDAGPGTAPPPVAPPSSPGTPYDSSLAPPEDTVPGPVAPPAPTSGVPPHVLDHATTGSLSTPFTALAAGSLPLGIGSGGATNGAAASGDTVALLASLPIQSAGTWLLPAADAFSSLPYPAFEIPVSPA